MTCLRCNGWGRVTAPNPAWTPNTPKESRGLSTGVHGRPKTDCPDCGGTGKPALPAPPG